MRRLLNYSFGRFFASRHGMWRGRLGLTSLLLMMVNVMLMAQSVIEEGYYYISNQASTSYFLCSTEVPSQLWNNNPNTPYLTTHAKTTADQDKFVWRVVKSGGYYHIVHELSGKYITRNPSPTNNECRVVHLESFLEPTEACLFDISKDYGTGTLLNIRPQGMTQGKNNKSYLNVSAGNKNDWGNIYGGGNAAEVTGNTNVTVGRQSE